MPGVHEEDGLPVREGIKGRLEVEGYQQVEVFLMCFLVKSIG